MTGRHRAEQPRDALGQFASPQCPTTYRVLAQATTQPVSNRTTVDTTRCPHGNYSRPGGPGRGCTPCGRPANRRTTR